MNTNQDATVNLIGWAGNMTASNCSLQGVHKGLMEANNGLSYC